jgi:hypothetical protein
VDQTAYWKERHAERRRLGLCGCGEPARPGKSLCAVCATRNLDAVVRRHEKLRELGLCTSCGKRNAEQWFGSGKWGGYCLTCSQKRSDNQKHSLAAALSSLQGRCHRKGLLLTISEERLIELWHQECYYCGLTDARGFNGLDQRIPSKGYTEENVVPCCRRCNYGKGTASETEFLEMCRRVTKRHGGVSSISNG